MEEPGSFSGIVISPKTVSGSGCQPAYVVGDLHHISRESLESAVSKYDLVLGGKRVELVGSSLEILACKLGNRLCDLLHQSPWGC